VGENRQELKALIGNLAAASKELQGLAQLARAQLSPGGDTATLIDNAAASSKLLRRDLPGISQNAAQALAGLAALSSGLTPEDGARLKAAIAAYSAAGQKLDQVATRADQILSRIEAGQGSLGGLTKDDQLYKDLRALVADLRQHPWKILWKQ
jgi:phospholipid/cholesterol/gamma-HCH transport system substrate-binding protein